MNPLQYINKIFCTLLFFSAGTKSYSQREIHPLEPMFTYDYAVKYSKNAVIKNLICNEFGVEYYFLENFKAPKGVQNIEILSSNHGSPFIGYSLIYAPIDEELNIRKSSIIKYYYNENGFLEKSVLIKPNYIEEVLNQFYYNEKNGLIEITSSDNKKYFFDKETGNLVHLINENYTLYFSYSKEITDLIVNIESENNILNFLYDEDVEKFYPLICRDCYKAKDIPAKWFLIYKNIKDDLHAIGNVVINNHYAGYSYEKSKCPNVFDQRILTEEAFVFDDNQKLLHYQIGQWKLWTGINMVASTLTKNLDNPYPSYSYQRKNDKKWILTDIEDSKDRKLGAFKVYIDGLYFNKTPIIVYNK